MEITLDNCRRALDALATQEVYMQGQACTTINNFLLAVKRELEKPKKTVMVTNSEDK